MDGNDRQLMTTTLGMPLRGRGRTTNDVVQGKDEEEACKRRERERSGRKVKETRKIVRNIEQETRGERHGQKKKQEVETRGERHGIGRRGSEGR